MFGYIKPFRPELKIREAEDYKAVYCGLCKELGRSYGIFARMTLSYDFAFMAMLFMSLDKNSCPSFEKCSCIAHPFKKQCRCLGNRAISLSARAAMILTYYKLKDDLSDKGFFKKIAAAVLFPFAASARKKALSFGEEAIFIDSAAAEMIAEQRVLEERKTPLPDEAAEPTAKFLSRIITLGGNSENERILERFGYLLGRYIYLCDALDDLEDDIKKENYNPFIFGGEKAVLEAKSALFLTTAELFDDLELLELDKYSEIVENTIDLGLKAEIERIINKKGGTENGKSI
ncbi:MAG: hypothetical protein E7479_02490 [Ruminococcaceae bacterium]|nr:hypothetical protein [Oscillospiraceae bacterium]